MAGTPRGVWLGSTLDESARAAFAVADEGDERAGRRLTRRLERQRAVTALLGAPVFLDVSILQTPSGPAGPLRLGGRPVLWSIWSPHRRLLIDCFDVLPGDAELDARDEFAQQHGLSYFYTPPGRVLNLDELRALLESESP